MKSDAKLEFRALLQRKLYLRDISRTNVASVGSVFNDTRKGKVLSLPETIKEKSLSFQVVREPLSEGYTTFYY